MQARRRPTMAEISAAVPDAPSATTPRTAVRPGRYNLAGDLFDPGGNPLTPVVDGLTVEEALLRIRAGARVAAEPCGCGGRSGDCAPSWSGGADLGRPMQLIVARNPKVPTWIDLWRGADGEVVFLHGDVAIAR